MSNAGVLMLTLGAGDEHTPDVLTTATCFTTRSHHEKYMELKLGRRSIRYKIGAPAFCLVADPYEHHLRYDGLRDKLIVSASQPSGLQQG